MPSLASRSRAAFRSCAPRARIATFAPDPANRRATATPMPLLPPVTRSFIVTSIFFFLLFVFEHDLIGKPVPTFPDHALGSALQGRQQFVRPLGHHHVAGA